jgi:hypothetical protein
LFIFPLLLPLALAAGHTLAGEAPMAPPSPDSLSEARTLVQTMKGGERGPYKRIAWFCADGSRHPAKPYPCGELGGGRQHAEYSTQRERLAALGWHVGTVTAALTWDELWQPEQRHRRLRELALERYLEAVDDGWVLRRARLYRGRVQLEDEEKNGRALLLKLMEQPGFLQDDFLLARELARAIPHGIPGGDRTRSIRHLAQEIADGESSFAPLRIEVHSRPSVATAGKVREWLSGRGEITIEGRTKAQRLAAGLDELYGLTGRQQRLKAAADALAKYSPAATRLIRESQDAEPALHIELLAKAMAQLRRDSGEQEPGASLRRLDLLTELEAELRTSALERLESPLTRRQLLVLARDLLLATWGLGLLSDGEHQALAPPLESLMEGDTVAADSYAFAARRLTLAGAWAGQTVRYSFAEPLLAYSALEPKAARFVDDLLRDSVLLPLGELAHRLSLDGARAAGIEHRLFGETAGGLLGINPGVARGRLRLLEPEELARGVQAAGDELVVLTETVADLNPVAGILTLGEGNPLSHVQMLARNLGIPNVALTQALLPRLREHAGERVLMAVAGDGRVLIEAAPETLAATPKTQAGTPVNAPLPDLAQRHPLPLSELHSGLSGRLVGPKAANVGQLNRLFPGRIAPAVALPFGIFAEHTLEPRRRLDEAFRRLRAGELDQAAFDAELEAVRRAVAGLSLSPELVAELRPMMAREFGVAGGYGLFVRSDTNAEDLPEFTGAGLNKTLPNVMGLEHQLAAVPEVWSSVYTARAMAWRSRVLANPEAVFASVLLMQSVPSEKSGVLVTADLTGDGEGLTVSVAWGVGGAVDNESAASRVLRPDGSDLVLAEAKAPFRRVLAPEGGVGWRPAQKGPVLTLEEMNALRRLAAEVVERYPPALDPAGRPLPWDIEFGFAGGRLWLLQIRPLVQRGRAEADAVVNAQVPSADINGRVQLDQVPGATAGGAT